MPLNGSCLISQVFLRSTVTIVVIVIVTVIVVLAFNTIIVVVVRTTVWYGVVYVLMRYKSLVAPISMS